MCDAGRMSYRTLQGENRLTHPLVRGEMAFDRTTWPRALGAATGRLQDLAAAHGPGKIGVIVSAESTNEEVFLVRRLAERLGATLAGISWSPRGAFADDFLIKGDKNPNTTGLARQGVPLDGQADALVAAAGRGELRALVLHRTDLTRWRDAATVQAALEKVPCLVVLDAHQHEVAQFADVVLPIATYVETDGTFTNFAGRVQRLRAAVPAPGESRAGWLVLGELLARLAGMPVPASAEAVFSALGSDTAAFAGQTYESLGAEGADAR
jgi:predicted molibdopterin-dependent oxidoreductase YjgC